MFDCAFKAFRGKRSIHYMAHLQMMAAAQPFISGAISKTVNMPNEATADDIQDAYVQAWKMGLKCVAIYRDGSKRSQPLNTHKTNEGGDKAAEGDSLLAKIKELEAELARVREEAGKPLRRRLSDTRTAVTHKFDIAGHEGYLTVGLFEDGQPGELFITMAKEGSTIGGLMDAIGTLTSMALQYGVPLEALVKKFCAPTLRAERLHQEPGNPPRQFDHRLRVPLDGLPVRSRLSGSHSTNRGQQELPMPGLAEEERKHVNRPVPDLPLSDDTEMVRGPSPAPGQTGGHGFLDRLLRQPTGRPHLPELRPCGRPQRRLFQVPQLRRKPRVLIGLQGSFADQPGPTLTQERGPGFIPTRALLQGRTARGAISPTESTP